MLLAQDFDSISSQAGLSEASGSSVASIIENVLPYAFYSAGILLLIYMVSGGFQVMVSRSDPKATAAGWGKISSALIGFMIVVLAYVITGLIGQVLGVGIFEQLFGGIGNSPANFGGAKGGFK